MGDNKSKRKLGLFPEGADEGRARLTAAKSAADLMREFPQVRSAEVGQSVLFEMSPDVFDGVEFGRIGRELCEGGGPPTGAPPGCDARPGRPR